jgi:hypothetical protein
MVPAPGVPSALAVPVAAVQPALGPLAVAGAAELVDFGVHEQLRRHLDHLAEQLAAGLGLEVLAHKLARAHRVGDVYRVLPSGPSQVLEG